MELLFIWIKQYKSLENVSFNFSNELRFQFDSEKRVLNVDANENFISGFFGENISNLTGVIGENGSGKTSILKYILQYCTQGVNEDAKESVIIFKDKSNIYYSSEFEIERGGSFNSKHFEKVEDLGDFKDSVTSVYLSNHFDPTAFYSNEYTTAQFHGIRNLSTYYLLHFDVQSRFGVDANDRRLSFDERMESFAVQEFKRIVRVLKWINSKAERNPFPVSPPPYINLRLLTIDPAVDKKSLPVMSRELEARFRPRNDFDRFLMKAFEAGIENLIGQQRFVSGSPAITNFHSELGDRVIHALKDMRIPLNENEAFSVRIGRIIDDVTVLENEVLHKQLHQIKSFVTVLEKFLVSKTTRIRLENSIVSVRVADANVRELIRLIDEYYNVENIVDYAEFFFSHSPYSESSLSSGEYVLLSVIGRLNSLKLDKNQTLLFLIDEAELALHPQWQKQFVSLLTDFVSERFKSQEVQIVLTSHSPFILSDLPPHCSIYLRKKGNKTSLQDSLDNRKDTFGANIHELFTDSFFLQNGLMGEFARQKIDALAKEVFLRDQFNQAYYNRVKKLINIIGEPFVREKILEKIMSGMDPESVDYLIQDRERELNRLKAFRRDQNRT